MTPTLTMTFAPFLGTPLAAAVAALLGALVGVLLSRELVTCGYRLPEEEVLEDGRPRPRPFHPRFVVLSCAALWGVLAWRLGSAAGWTLLPAYLVLATIGVALLWVDVDVHRLPRGLTVPLLPTVLLLLTLASWAAGDWSALRRAAICGVVLWLVFLVLAVVAAVMRSGFGLGDVQLAGILGVATGYLSPWGPLVTSYVAFISAGVLAVVKLVRRSATRSSEIAFGPWLLLGGLVAVITEVPKLL